MKRLLPSGRSSESAFTTVSKLKPRPGGGIFSSMAARRTVPRSRPSKAARPPAGPPARVALETTLLLHGVPRAQALSLARDLAETVRAGGAVPVFVGVVAGRAKAGLSDADLRTLVSSRQAPKLNTSTLGI